jgi:anti-sigma regulatory factor (Ser/Thr protein kinase)
MPLPMPVDIQDVDLACREHVAQYHEHDQELELTGEFSCGRDAPGRARRLAVAALRRWGIEETLVDDAALVLSELANNAVIHARSSFSVEICAQACALRIAVADPRPRAFLGKGGSLTPRVGHGLGVIEAISSAWGVEDRPEGKVVWAELRRI